MRVRGERLIRRRRSFNLTFSVSIFLGRFFFLLSSSPSASASFSSSSSSPEFVLRKSGSFVRPSFRPLALVLFRLSYLRIFQNLTGTKQTYMYFGREQAQRTIFFPLSLSLSLSIPFAESYKYYKSISDRPLIRWALLCWRAADFSQPVRQADNQPTGWVPNTQHSQISPICLSVFFSKFAIARRLNMNRPLSLFHQ